MVLRMASPTKAVKTGMYLFRVRVPADLVPVVGKKVYSFTLGTKDPVEAKRLFLEAQTQKEREHAVLRMKPGTITLKKIMELAGTAYRDLANSLEDEPGETGIWASYQDLMTRIEAGGQTAKEKWHGEVVDKLLIDAGISADASSRSRLIEETHKAFALLGQHQSKRAYGDFSPDLNIDRFPVPSGRQPTHSITASGSKKGITITSLLELWKRDHEANEKATATSQEWSQKTKDFIKWLGHDDALKVTARDISEYLDHLRHDRGLATKTIGTKYLACIRRIFTVGKNKHLIDINPAADVIYDVVKPKSGRGKDFTDIEANQILAAAIAAPSLDDRRPMINKVACRWVPWICAYTGARVSEITQLRKEDFFFENSLHYLQITPEAGSVKTNEYRLCPIHPHLIETGLLDFVKSRPDGPLFYDRPKVGGQPWNTQAKQVARMVGLWVREVAGVTDKRVAPNHGWRHRFKTVARDVGIDRSYMDAIQGHSDGSASTGYGTNTMRALDREIRKLPRYKTE